jgi:hypothetical protein
MIQHDTATRTAILTSLLTEIGVDAVLEVFDRSNNVLATFEDVNFTQAAASATLTAGVTVNASADGQVVRSKLRNVAGTRYQEIIYPSSTEIQLSTFFLSAGVPVTLSGYTIGAPS